MPAVTPAIRISVTVMSKTALSISCYLVPAPHVSLPAASDRARRLGQPQRSAEPHQQVTSGSVTGVDGIIDDCLDPQD
jgi:hypothetical protein